MENNYVKIHLHTDLSNGTTNIDSVTKFNQYIDRAKELNMKAIAFTEHGNLFAWQKKMLSCKEANIKYIHGVEAYITETLSEKIRDNYHCCLYALNTKGLFELNKMISKAYNRKDNHFYYVPRISIDELISTSDNIAISTACLGGILNNGNNNIKKFFIKFLKENKRRCFLEIQHHNVESQKKYNKLLLELHKTIQIPLIIGTDTHALNKEHLEGRSVLQKSKCIFFNNEDGWDLSFKTYEELIELYEEDHKYIPITEIKLALENTNKLADMVEDYELDFNPKYPKICDNPIEVFKEKIKEGIVKRGINLKKNYKQYIQRINEEFKIYVELGAVDYMLLQTTILDKAREQGIQWGYGRGSVNGSIIAYLLGITECDSVRFKLNFFRFMNPHRASMPDIDIDYSKKDREWVKDYLFKMEGIYSADIITFNTIALKGSIRDVCKALYKDEIPKELNEQVKIDTEGYGKLTDNTREKIEKYTNNYLKISNYICENVETNEEDMRKLYPEVFKYVDIVNGTIVSIGTHPSGTIVSPIPLDEFIGTCSLTTTDKPVSMIQMKEVDKFGLVKLDILGLDNIGVINETCKVVNIKRLSPDTINFNDDKVYDSILEDTTTIFQMESNTALDYLRRILNNETFNKLKGQHPELTKFDVLKFTNGAIRPAGESFRDKASEGICGNNGLKELDDMLFHTLGYCLLQEQIMMFLVKFCGYSMAESDLVRRAIAKKGGTEQYIPEIKERFINYSTKNFKISFEKANKIIEPFIEIVISAQNYGFSDNHNFPYTTTSYISAYLRYYYPLEYLTICLNTWSDDAKKTPRIIEYVNSKGIEIKPVKFRYSKSEYMFDKKTNSIYKGIASIKYLNEQVANELYELKDNKYNNFIELLEDINNKTSCDSKKLDILIKLDFFEEFGKAKKLLRAVEIFNTYYGKKQFKKDKLNISSDVMRKFSHKETEKIFKEVDISELIKYLYSQLEDEDITIQEKIEEQIDKLGNCCIRNPKYPKTVMAILDVNTKYTPTLTAYRLYDGKTAKIKIPKKTFKETPIKVFDLINLKETQVKNKRKFIDGEWKVTDEKELWAKLYSFVL